MNDAELAEVQPVIAVQSDDGLDGVRRGHYATKHSKAVFLAWSHGARFRKGRVLVEHRAGQSLLDYGCGDGTFLQQVGDLFPNSIGADLAADQIADCRMRFGSKSSQRFFTNDDLKSVAWEKKFDVVVCMEVLEHCRDHVVEQILIDIARLIRSNGLIVISVPIETGISVSVKQLLRRVAAWKNISGYTQREVYSPAEMLKMIFATKSTPFTRPVYAGNPDDEESGYHGHKGFNWKRLETMIAHHFVIDRTAFTPMPMLRSLLNSQVWFVCSARD